MMNSFYEWLNSGRFLYCLVSEARYSSDTTLSSEYPDATGFSNMRILNVDKKEAEGLVTHLGEVTYILEEGTTLPVLLSHKDVLSAVSNSNGEIDG